MKPPVDVRLVALTSWASGCAAMFYAAALTWGEPHTAAAAVASFALVTLGGLVLWALLLAVVPP